MFKNLSEEPAAYYSTLNMERPGSSETWENFYQAIYGVTSQTTTILTELMRKFRRALHHEPGESSLHPHIPFHSNSHPSFRQFQRIQQRPLTFHFVTMWGHPAPCPIPTLEIHPSLAVYDWIFNIFTTNHPFIWEHTMPLWLRNIKQQSPCQKKRNKPTLWPLQGSCDVSHLYWQGASCLYLRPIPSQVESKFRHSPVRQNSVSNFSKAGRLQLVLQRAQFPHECFAPLHSSYPWALSNYAPDQENICGSGGIAPRFLMLALDGDESSA
jgi:hypothetical protein